MHRFSLENARKPGERRTEPPSIPTARIRYHKLDTTGRGINGSASVVYPYRHGGKKSRNRKNKRKGTRKQKRNKRV
jgi:hypothetical protein